MTTTNATCARTILAQIGTDALCAVSARQRVYDADSITFAYGPSTYRKITVKLDRARDTYTVKAVKINRKTFAVTETAAYSDAYAEDLARIVRTINNAI